MPSFRGYFGDQVNASWDEPIVIRSKNPVQKPTTKPSSSAPTAGVVVGNKKNTVPSSHLTKVERKSEEGNFAVKKVGLTLGRAISSARTAKGWTQKDLATRSGVPLDIVRGYEQGTAVANGPYTTKIKRALGTV